MRIEETGAWRTGSLLRDVSTHQLMLSATPINLGSDDLFNVLRLLDPDHFEYPEDFRNVVLANRPVIAASDAVRYPTSDADQILAAIREIKGVADRTVARIMAEMPEIGTVSNKAVSKLAGLAPLANDSGKSQGKRSTRGGRIPFCKAMSSRPASTMPSMPEPARFRG